MLMRATAIINVLLVYSRQSLHLLLSIKPVRLAYRVSSKTQRFPFGVVVLFLSICVIMAELYARVNLGAPGARVGGLAWRASLLLAAMCASRT